MCSTDLRGFRRLSDVRRPGEKTHRRLQVGTSEEKPTTSPVCRDIVTTMNRTRLLRPDGDGECVYLSPGRERSRMRSECENRGFDAKNGEIRTPARLAVRNVED